MSTIEDLRARLAEIERNVAVAEDAKDRAEHEREQALAALKAHGLDPKKDLDRQLDREEQALDKIIDGIEDLLGEALKALEPVE